MELKVFKSTQVLPEENEYIFIIHNDQSEILIKSGYMKRIFWITESEKIPIKNGFTIKIKESKEPINEKSYLHCVFQDTTLNRVLHISDTFFWGTLPEIFETELLK